VIRVSEVLRSEDDVADRSLQVYLLGQVDFAAALFLQRHLASQAAGDSSRSALILCEHAPLITIGREGSRAQVLYEPEELTLRGWPIRWVNRGGGCLLHLPGQMAIYSILPLDRLGLGLQEYLARLHQVVIDVLGDCTVTADTRPAQPGIWVGPRPVAHVGVAVCDWVSYYGAALNVHPDLEPFRHVRTNRDDPPMTSLERERHGSLRASMVRERVVEHFAARFDFGRTSLFFHHPVLDSGGAVAARRLVPGRYLSPGD
jgi:lipoyl(octanoyl) transferase